VSIDVAEVRRRFPALARTLRGLPVAYLDGPGGSQMVDSCIEGMAAYLRRGTANLGGAFVTAEETEQVVAEAREVAAALLGAQSSEVAFGQSTTALAFSVAAALGATWREGDNVVVTELDHRANVDPWIWAARRAGAQVRWIPVDPEGLVLDLDGLDRLIDERTRLVAVGRASNAVGTINDLGPVALAARSAGSLMAVDAVHAAPHIPLDMDDLGADVIFCSAYKFFGPHLGIVAIRQELFERMEVAKVEPSPSSPPDKLEMGTQNHEGLAGLPGSIGFIASLGTGVTLRERVTSGMAEIRAWEDGLASRLRKELAAVPGLRPYWAGNGVEKTPTVTFRLEGYSPREVATHLARHGLFVEDGNFYASTLDERLGTRDSGGWVRAGLAPYTTPEEVAACHECVARLAAEGNRTTDRPRG